MKSSKGLNAESSDLSSDKWERVRLATSIDTSPAELAELGRDDHAAVRVGVAMNSNTPPATLYILSQDESITVANYATRNPSFNGDPSDLLFTDF